MLVEIKPIDSVKWHGKKGKDSFARPKVVEVLYDNETGGYATGLTEQEVVEYGKKLGVNLSDSFNPEEAHSYWGSKASWIYLPNHTVVLNTDKAVEFVKVKNAKASKFVANSQQELEEGKWPEATHVIYDEEEEVAIKASKIALTNKARELTFKLDLDGKAAVVQILSKKTVKKRSASFIEVEIEELIETKAEELIKTIQMGREDVTIRSQVLEAQYKNILTQEGSAIYYLGNLIGLTIDDAVAWFKDPNNQKIKVNILEKLNKK